MDNKFNLSLLIIFFLIIACSGKEKKVIALNPEVIIPSHGIPMRTTHRLKETLKHRLQHESQILKLHQAGKSKQEILRELYSETDHRLHPAAVQNIESHLAKLRKENVL